MDLPSRFEALLITLAARFDANPARHPGISWNFVQDCLLTNPLHLASILQMEQTGGEPDVVLFLSPERLVFADCSAESPIGRRSLCYDQRALDARKQNKPQGSALQQAAAMGIQILSEAEYRQLQLLGAFDTRTSSWIETPSRIRELGGALFCDRRYDTVFTYHNGAESYYAARGFRGSLDFR